MPRALRPVGSLPAEALTQVAHAARLETLEEVLRGGFDVLDVIVQDEFTHDVVTRGRAPMFVVFDTT